MLRTSLLWIDIVIMVDAIGVLLLMIMLLVIVIPNKHNHAVRRIDYEDSLHSSSCLSYTALGPPFGLTQRSCVYPTTGPLSRWRWGSHVPQSVNCFGWSPLVLTAKRVFRDTLV